MRRRFIVIVERRIILESRAGRSNYNRLKPGLPLLQEITKGKTRDLYDPTHYTVISEFELFRALPDDGAVVKPNENPSVPSSGAILSECDVIDADIAMKNTFIPQVSMA